MSSKLESWVTGVAISVSLLHLWMNIFGTLAPLWQNALHYASFIVLAGMTLHSRSGKSFIPGTILAITAAIAVCSLIALEDSIYARGVSMTLPEMAAATFAILVTIEFVRRVSGPVIPVLIILILSYMTWLGPHIAGTFRFSGLNVETVLFRSIYGDDALLGSIATISSTYVFMFILFGAFLLAAGTGEVILGLSHRVARKVRGGAGFVAITASALSGMISGSAIANTASTGVITIPLMKRSGFTPRFAAAVESAASVGGQLMPPIMGAGAFVMASFTQIPYTTIALYSVLPALIYFASLFFYVYIEARKQGITSLAEDCSDQVSRLNRRDWLHLLPVIVLIALLIYGYTPTYAAGMAILCVIVCGRFTSQGMSLRQVVNALAMGSRNMVFTAILMLAIGLIVNGISTTGIGNTFSLMISDWSGQSLLLAFVLIALASLVLGMGLPVTAAYIVLATLSAPVLYNLLTEQQLLAQIAAGYAGDSLTSYVTLLLPEHAQKLGQPLPLEDARLIFSALPDSVQHSLRSELLSPQILTTSLLAAHLVIFWLSQDSNVTPPVCLVAFTAAAIAGSRPMATGLLAWKLAKGIYIVPLLFLFTPLLGGNWQEMLILTMHALFAMYAISAAFQGHLLAALHPVERLILILIAIVLLWPCGWIEKVAAFSALGGLAAYQQYRAGVADDKDALPGR